MKPRPALLLFVATAPGAHAELARAQAVSVDAIDDENAKKTEPPTPLAGPPTKAPEVTLPQVLTARAVYPEGAKGEAEVVLELTVSEQGAVSEVIVVRGTAPFAESATSAARAFRFAPATRDGRAVPARIRFLVRFVPPAPEAPAEQIEPASQGGSEAGVATRPRAVPAPYEVTVVAERPPLAARLGRAEVRELPGAFGDAFRAIEALPGVVPIASGLPYFYVRGAPPGNVGYFFDGIPVPILYHFAAGPGVLHPAFVDHVDLYPGAYPARYGRFAGGIVAGEPAPPAYAFHGEASIRLIDSGAMVEAPFAEERGSVMLGGRFSYTGFLLSLIVPEVTLNYWDYQGRVRYALDPDDSVEAFFFGSGDFLAENRTLANGREEQQSLVDISFHRVDLRWHRERDESELRAALFLGRDSTGFGDDEALVTNNMLGARSELERRFSDGLVLRAGGDVLVEDFTQDVGDVTVDGDVGAEGDEGFDFDLERTDLTLGVFGEMKHELARGVEVTGGLRSDLFVSGQDLALGLDPRLSVRYRLSEKLSAVHGFGLSHQSPSFVVPIPGFKPSLRGGLQRAVQHSAGVERELEGGFFASAVLFHNLFFNMTDLLGIARLSDTAGRDPDPRTTGRAYGAEISIRRSLARHLGGFLSYTLSRSERSSGALEGPATTDRAHVLSAALSYDLGREWRLGGRALLYSGIPARVAYVAAARNPPRTPAFYRIDLRLEKRWYIERPKIWWGLVLEMLNTTLNKEVLQTGCNAYRCVDEEIGPVSIPSIGVEGAF